MSDSPSPPPAPDYVGAATAQGSANKDSAIATAQLSNPNVTTPYGSQKVTYSLDPTTGNPVPNITQSLAPDQQALLTGQTGLSTQLMGLGNQFLPKVADQLATPINSGSAQAATDKAYQTFKARLDPQWAQNDQVQASTLANQGIAQGSEAYNNAERTYGQQKNDAYQQANVAAQQLAPQTQALDIQGQSSLINALNAIRTGSQVSTPQFQPYQGSQVAPAPVFAGTQAAGQAGQNIYNAQVGASNANTSGLYGLGGTALTAAMMFSDRRLKSKIAPLGGGWYSYEIAGIPTIGVMADEVDPRYVVRLPSGYLAVDYDALRHGR